MIEGSEELSEIVGSEEYGAGDVEGDVGDDGEPDDEDEDRTEDEQNEIRNRLNDAADEHERRQTIRHRGEDCTTKRMS